MTEKIDIIFFPYKLKIFAILPDSSWAIISINLWLTSPYIYPLPEEQELYRFTFSLINVEEEWSLFGFHKINYTVELALEFISCCIQMFLSIDKG